MKNYSLAETLRGYETCPRSWMPLPSSNRSPLMKALRQIKNDAKVALRFPYKDGQAHKIQKRAHEYADRMGFHVETSKDENFVYIAKREMHDSHQATD